MAYKLYYFDFPGRAEVARLCLTIGNIPHEFVDVKREDWPALKPKMPFGQVPVLEFPDGSILAQQGAIDRYVAKLAGLYPEDPLGAALADQAVYLINDFWMLFMPSFGIKDLDERIKARQATMAGGAKDVLNGLSRVLEPVESSGKYIAGDKLSYGDLAVFTSLSIYKSGYMDGIPNNYLDNFPVLKSFRSRIAGQPGVRAYYDKYSQGLRAAFKPDE